MIEMTDSAMIRVLLRNLQEVAEQQLIVFSTCTRDYRVLACAGWFNALMKYLARLY